MLYIDHIIQNNALLINLWYVRPGSTLPGSTMGHPYFIIKNSSYWIYLLFAKWYFAHVDSFLVSLLTFSWQISKINATWFQISHPNALKESTEWEVMLSKKEFVIILVLYYEIGQIRDPSKSFIDTDIQLRSQSHYQQHLHPSAHDATSWQFRVAYR